jgi:cytochrome c peroxidase
MTIFKSLFSACLLLANPFPAFAFDYLQSLPQQTPVPADNPQSPAKIALGKRLFFDTQLLGAESKISCNSCHNLAQGGDDNRSLSIGQAGKPSKRSAPSLWNIGFQTVLYWDGRVVSLESQTLDHLRDPVVASWRHIGALVDHLNRSPEYQQAFRIAFPEDKNTLNGISGVNIARALSSFERSLLARNSAFDRYLAGDKSALSASAKRGIQAFNEAGCLACHFGANFAGPAPGPALKMGDGFYELFPNNRGYAVEAQYNLADDQGRFEATGDPGERFMWRVPPLRGIALTAPYFHNGSVDSLEEAIRIMGLVQFNKTLSEESVRDISAFLHSLTGELQ